MNAPIDILFTPTTGAAARPARPPLGWAREVDDLQSDLDLPELVLPPATTTSEHGSWLLYPWRVRGDITALLEWVMVLDSVAGGRLPSASQSGGAPGAITISGMLLGQPVALRAHTHRLPGDLVWLSMADLYRIARVEQRRSPSLPTVPQPSGWPGRGGLLGRPPAPAPAAEAAAAQLAAAPVDQPAAAAPRPPGPAKPSPRPRKAAS